MGDLNNDGSPELFVTDMLPASEQRLKQVAKFDTYDFYRAKVRNGYHHQVMRNTLQLNNGDGTFREVGQYAGVHATDWSWGAVMTDFDNDGQMEIFVANGVYRDVTDQDFIDYLASEENIGQALATGQVDFQKFVDKMPSHKLSNFMFHREPGGFAFADSAAAWGLGEASFSNGSAYGDLDNDGDLDLIVNNVNQELFVYRNNTETLRPHHHLRLQLQGEGANSFGVGALVKVYTPEGLHARENMPMRGFQSSMDYGLAIGLGQASHIDSVVVEWGPGLRQVVTEVALDQLLTLKRADARQTGQPGPRTGTRTKAFEEHAADLDFTHEENTFVDWDRERMLYHMLSTEGPALAHADVNGDGLEDVYLGGAANQAGELWLQQPNGQFQATKQEDLALDAGSEDVAATFFDANGDGHPDLYVVSGGGEYPERHPNLQDRLYLNNGQGKLRKQEGAIPTYAESGGCVAAADYDADGDVDLFVGVRHIPGKYGVVPGSHLLQNDGQGRFTDVGTKTAFGIENLGMVTDALWSDYDRDGDLDLLVVGEWMPLVIYKNTGENLERLNNVPGLETMKGWWNELVASDLDGDGDEDYLLGNWGLNTRYRARPEEPLTLYVKDFDDNKTLDHVFAQYHNGKPYTVALKHDLEGQMAFISKRFVYYRDFSDKTLHEIFTEEELSDAIRHEVHTLASIALINQGDGTFRRVVLPEAVQFAPVFSLAPLGETAEGGQAFLVGGNFGGVRPEEGGYAANHGLVLLYQPETGFRVLSPEQSGFSVEGEVRDMAVLSQAGRSLIVVARNNDPVLTFWYHHSL